LKKFIPVAFAIALSAASLSANAVITHSDRYGDASIPRESSRTIVVGPNTRWINVAQDEVVKIVTGGQEFTWQFGGMDDRVSLKQIAPAEFAVKDIFVYVAQEMSSSD